MFHPNQPYLLELPLPAEGSYHLFYFVAKEFMNNSIQSFLFISHKSVSNVGSFPKYWIYVPTTKVPLTFAALNLENFTQVLKTFPLWFISLTKFFSKPSFICRGRRTFLGPTWAWQWHFFLLKSGFLANQFAWMQCNFVFLLSHIH